MANEGYDPPRTPGLGTTWPGRTTPTWTGFPNPTRDSEVDLGELRGEPNHDALPVRWIGWRRNAFVAVALVVCVVLYLLQQAMCGVARIDAEWRADAHGRLELGATTEPALVSHIGETLTGLVGGATAVALDDAVVLNRSPRWIIEDAERARALALQRQLASVLDAPEVTLFFAGGDKAVVAPRPRSAVSMPIVFWLAMAFAVALCLSAAFVFIARPIGRNLLFAVMALCQAGNLVFIAAVNLFDLGMPAALARWDLPARAALDLCTAAAMVNAACLHPRRLPGSGWIALVGWGVALALSGALAAGWLEQAWWCVQGGVVALGLLALGLLSWSYQIEPHPFALVLRRFGIVMIATWSLLTIALALASANGLPAVTHNVTDVGSLVWYAFLASLLLMMPFLTRSQNAMREFSLIAAISTVATSLDLLFVAVFSLGQFASLTLALVVSLAIYASVRQWILNQLAGSSMLTTERMFEQLYRIAREVEARPEHTPALLGQLLGELFEPLAIGRVDKQPTATRIAGDGSSMLVPMPRIAGDAPDSGALLIRFAQRGRRLFTSEDARLADRVVEQLARAVHFDRAVEHGRSEERMRLAQDLHDDIGARLLTLMYKAQSPEMEDYVRHTLQDLKTLTRGLAASHHRLSHAAAEWKSDLAHRLTAAHVDLKWNFAFDEDILLTVVHWSALTRVMRELVNNVIAHSQAQRLEIDFKLEGDRLDLLVNDDGVGRNPRAWSHGLGLGGVRKRVKQLGGEVEWRELTPRGISCRVVIRDLTAR